MWDVTNTTIISKHVTEEPNVKESVQESVHKFHWVCQQPDQYRE